MEQQEDGQPMPEKVRVSVVALLPSGMPPEDMQRFLGRLGGGEEGSAAVTVFKTPELPGGSRRLFAKISRVFTPDGLDDRWHLDMTDEFYKVGCEDVAWRITRLQPTVIDVETTTCSFLLELFRDSLPPGIESRLVPEQPPMPFGSEAFWRWIGEETL
jgi:hypothetical protein